MLSNKQFKSSYDLQSEVLKRFYESCGEILGDVCPLKPFDEDLLRLEKNLFSSFFLMVLSSIIPDSRKLFFYGLINQAMRAMVTGCDNILDEEYKEVLSFDLPDGGTRFRSVLTIMTGEMIITKLALECYEVDKEFARKMPPIILRSLIPSGLQEHSEEKGVNAVLPPEKILEKVHDLKTGLLFEAPVLNAIESGDIDGAATKEILKGLNKLGLASQILDDIKDIHIDIALKKHNYVVSKAIHSCGENVKCEMEKLLQETVVDLEKNRNSRHFGGGYSLEIAHILPAVQTARVDSNELFATAFEHFKNAGIGADNDFWNALQAGISSLIHSGGSLE